MKTGNELALIVENFIESKGVRKTFVADEIGISYSYFQNLLGKKNFTVDDANRILAALDHQIEVNIVPIKKV